MEPLNFGIFDWVEASATLAPAEVYAHKLDLAAAADAAGFHGMFLAEHQGTPLSIDGSPSVLLSAIFQRTRRLRAGALAYCLPWHDPYRLYHEVCMLDQLSGGRLELGVGRGVSPIESKIFGMNSIEESRERYREALEVFFQACANPALDFDGKLFHYRDAELHVQPRAEAVPAAVVSEQQPRVDRVHRAPRLPHRVSRQAHRLQAAFRALPRGVAAPPRRSRAAQRARRARRSSRKPSTW